MTARNPKLAGGYALCGAPALVVAGLMAPFSWGPVAHAEDASALAHRLHGSGEILSLEQVSKRARALRPGTLIDAALAYEAEHGGYVYELRFLDPQGLAWQAEFDARTGALIEDEAEGD
jgi:uncharacterized membrane protein YkoI